MPLKQRRRGPAPDSLGGPERSPVERSETERSGGPPRESAPVVAPSSTPIVPDPEVPARAQRRQYTAEYKLRILSEADACAAFGEIGSLLRREGLYSSHLLTWRRQRDQGAICALGPRKRGKKAKGSNPFARKVAQLESENKRLRTSLQDAQTIIEFQKKVSDLLSIPLRAPDRDESV